MRDRWLHPIRCLTFCYLSLFNLLGLSLRLHQRGWNPVREEEESYTSYILLAKLISLESAATAYSWN